jgi:FKBP12-rapamycin complex-associated protein
LRETSFVQSFGHDLNLAHDHLRRYRVHGDQAEIQQAWDIYYSVSRKTVLVLNQLTFRSSNASASN